MGTAHAGNVQGTHLPADSHALWTPALGGTRSGVDLRPPQSESVVGVFIRAASRVTPIALFGALPLITLATLVEDWSQRGIVAIDFRQFYGAAEAILSGSNPYPSMADSVAPWAQPDQYPYPYPPLPALVTTPLTVLPLEAAQLLVMTASILVAVAIPFVLGVRDWRCYGLLLLWPPVLSAIQTSNPTLLLALAAALAWRFRERPQRLGATVGLTLALKFFLWPLLVWLVASRRLVSSVVAAIVGAGLLVLSWALIDFSGFLGYPAILRATEDRWGDDAYTFRNFALDLGASPELSTAVGLTVGLALLGAVVVVGRRGDDRRAFIIVLAAAFALSPLVWLQYFAFLAVVVAVAQPRLGFLWFVPLAMIVSTGSGHPTAFVAGWTLFVAALTLALALRVTQASPSPGRLFVRRDEIATAAPT